VNRSVHLDQLAEALAAWASASVGVTVLAWLPQSLGDKPTAESFQTDHQAALGEFLACESRSEVVEVRAVLVEDTGTEIGIDLAVGRSVAESVEKSGISAFLDSVEEPSDVSRCDVEQACRFGLRP
jgi:hypothetical protein